MLQYQPAVLQQLPVSGNAQRSGEAQYLAQENGSCKLTGKVLVNTGISNVKETLWKTLAATGTNIIQKNEVRKSRLLPRPLKEDQTGVRRLFFGIILSSRSPTGSLPFAQEGLVDSRGDVCHTIHISNHIDVYLPNWWLFCWRQATLLSQ